MAPIVDQKEAVAHDTSSHSSDTGVDAEKGVKGEHVEQIHTNERIPGHPEYYEKNGLRTYGDGVDHDHEPPVRPLCCTTYCYVC